MTPTQEALGPAVRARRAACGMSQRDLAAAIGVSAAFVSQVEGGHRRPSLDVLERFAEALGTSPGTLLGSGPTPPPLVHGATALEEIQELVHDEADALALVAHARLLLESPAAEELGAYAAVVAEYADVLEAFAQQRYRGTTGAAIVVVTAALSYVVDPQDAWPDAHPHGRLDDIGVLAFTHALVADELDDFHAWRNAVRRA